MQQHSTATLYITAIAASFLSIGLTSLISKNTSPTSESATQVETAIVNTASDKDRYAALRKAYPEYMRQVEAAKHDADTKLKQFKTKYPEATWTSGTRDIVSEIGTWDLPQAEEGTFQRNGGLQAYKKIIARIELAERYMFCAVHTSYNLDKTYRPRDGVSAADAKKWCGV